VNLGNKTMGRPLRRGAQDIWDLKNLALGYVPRPWNELSRIDEGALTKVEMALKTVMAADAPSIDELDRDVYATPISYPV